MTATALFWIATGLCILCVFECNAIVFFCVKMFLLEGGICRYCRKSGARSIKFLFMAGVQKIIRHSLVLKCVVIFWTRRIKMPLITFPYIDAPCARIQCMYDFCMYVYHFLTFSFLNFCKTAEKQWNMLLNGNTKNEKVKELLLVSGYFWILVSMRLILKSWLAFSFGVR